MKRCLYCYQSLNDNEKDFHARCSKKIFGTSLSPELTFSEEQIMEMAEKTIRSQTAVTGVQPKLSLNIEKATAQKNTEKFTIVGLWGDYILKPPAPAYRNLPEIEDLTMHLARLCEINTVPHSLILLKNGSLSYITKRIDRDKGEKFHMEDMCQLTERLTENKYDGSYEQIAKAILQFSAAPGLDAINFYEQVIFSFLTGNADMHLKNFSLIAYPEIGYTLAPAYDLVATALVNKEDNEELALTLNAKKRKIKKGDFIAAFTRIRMDEKVQRSIFSKFSNTLPLLYNFIEISFLPKEMKAEYKALIMQKAKQIELI